jgi:hypothetical protein
LAYAAAAAGAVLGLLLAFGDAGPYRWLSRLPVVRGFRVPERYLLSWSLGLVLAASVALSFWLSRTRRPRTLAICSFAILAVDLLVHARLAAPTAESSLYDVEPAIVRQVRSRLGAPDEAGFPRRFISGAASLNVTPFPDDERRALLRQVGALKGTIGMRYGLESASGAGPSLAWTERLFRQPNAQVLALGAVGVAILAGQDASGNMSPFAPPVLLSTSPLPRAFLVPEAIVVPEERAADVVSSPSLDPLRTAVLEEGSPLASDPAWRREASAVRLVERRPTLLRLEAKTPGRAILVLLDAWEKGWRASVDGAEEPVRRADGAFRAVRLEAGEHRVEFRYVPPGLREGIGLSVVGFLGLALTFLRLHRRVPAGPPRRF